LVGSIFHMIRKIVSEMTYNVSMGTLNPTIPYHSLRYDILSLRLAVSLDLLLFIMVYASLVY